MKIFKYSFLLVLIGIPLFLVRDFSIYYRSIHAFVLIVPGTQDEYIGKPGVYHTDDWPVGFGLLSSERQRELNSNYTEWIKSNLKIQRARSPYAAQREPPEYVEYLVTQRGARWGIKFKTTQPGYYRFSYRAQATAPESVKYLVFQRRPDKGYWGTIESLVLTPVGLVVFFVIACSYIFLLIVVARIGTARRNHVEQETDADTTDT